MSKRDGPPMTFTARVSFGSFMSRVAGLAEDLEWLMGLNPGGPESVADLAKPKDLAEKLYLELVAFMAATANRALPRKEPPQ